MGNMCQVTDDMKHLLDESLQVLGLLVRTINGLENHDGVPDKHGRVLRVTTIGELLQLTEEDLLSRPGFGDKTLDEVRECLAKKGFHTRQKYFPQRKEDKEYTAKMERQVTFKFGRRQNKSNASPKSKDGRSDRTDQRKRHRAA